MEQSDLIRDSLALTLVPGLGPRLTDALLEHFGSATAIRKAGVRDLCQIPHIGEKLATQFVANLQSVDVDSELARMEEHGVVAVIKNTPAYPTHLRNIEDAPYLLYIRGTLSPADINAVAVIGSRTCTSYGRRMTEQLCKDLARAGYTVVSGLARGIDGEAHQAALAGGGRTLAVLAGGLSRIYPPEHAGLAKRVVESGALISETPMKMEPQKGMFHARNRLISGLSLGVVVVEANARSGTLITVRHAAEQNRDVFAFPGNADSQASEGTLDLLRNQGAKLIRGIDDLLEDLQGMLPAKAESIATAPSPAPTPRKAETAAPPPSLDSAQQRIWDFLTENRHLDVIVRELELSVSEAQRQLMTMEMKRIVQRLPGNQYARRTPAG